MENNKRVEFVGSIIIFFALLFVYSKWGPAIPFSTTTQSRGEPMMVEATGKSAVVPDIAKISFGIEQNGTSLKAVQESVNKKSSQLTSELKKLGIEEKDIKTINYNVYPEYDYNTTPMKINGYRVSTNYEVKILDFEKVNDAIVIATQAGANTISNISFEVNDKTKEEYTQKAREEAVKLAKEKAQGLAKASGITLGKIINVTESSGLNYPRPIAYAKEMSSGGADLANVANVTPGETEITVNVTLSYEIR